MTETYTFVEPIVIVARDDAGNAPATSDVIVIKPGLPDEIQFASNPPWVGGNKTAQLTARVVDFYDNPVPGEPMSFALISGTGTLTPIDNQTDAAGVARGATGRVVAGATGFAASGAGVGMAALAAARRASRSKRPCSVVKYQMETPAAATIPSAAAACVANIRVRDGGLAAAARPAR